MLLADCSAATRDADLRKRIDLWGLDRGKLCAAPLRFPAPLDPKAPQYWFQNLMVHEGVLHVVQPPSRSGPALVAVTPAFAFTARARKWLPGYREICYGSIHTTRILSVVEEDTGFLTVRFEYSSSLDPWGQAIGPFLQIKSRGQATVLMGPRNQTSGELTILRPPAINFRVMLYPPTGNTWYPPDKFPNGWPGAVPHRIDV
ncbi:MAG: hypothetical protein JWO85_2902 [Candidatus Eremiobacteraeota bacterium]|nr:hypothetical protein [Candidatus Eremiobacteraeota bacterium]